jgi:hypothetical protein
MAAGATSRALGPGQTEVVALVADPALATAADTFVASVGAGPGAAAPLYRECRADNDTSPPATPACR